MNGKDEVKIRVYGVDCPESRQPFGQRAKQFTSAMVYGKHVKVIAKNADKYGRTVAMISVDGQCLSQSLVENGYAWVYTRYCAEPERGQWEVLETAAREEGRGLWAMADALPPWEWRRPKVEGAPGRETSTAKAAPSAERFENALEYHGNTVSLVFHKPECKAFDCKNCTAIFASRRQAEGAGYTPCGTCNP